MLRRLLRSPRVDTEVGIAIPIGCMVPRDRRGGAGRSVGAGVFVGTRLTSQPATDHVVVRVIDDGAKGGPQVLSTQIVPLH